MHHRSSKSILIILLPRRKRRPHGLVHPLEVDPTEPLPVALSEPLDHPAGRGGVARAVEDGHVEPVVAAGQKETVQNVSGRRSLV
jgi:hypothetical protein